MIVIAPDIANKGFTASPFVKYVEAVNTANIPITEDIAIVDDFNRSGSINDKAPNAIAKAPNATVIAIMLDLQSFDNLDAAIRAAKQAEIPAIAFNALLT